VQLTDQLVRDAQQVFLPVWEQTKGNDGYVSFEVDPLLEDVTDPKLPAMDQRRIRSVELAKKCSRPVTRTMIRFPRPMRASRQWRKWRRTGVTINVTLIFSKRQYIASRDAIWRGRSGAARG
jgi:transaldolase